MNAQKSSWRRRLSITAPFALALTLVAIAAVGLAPHAAAHRQAPSSKASVTAVQYPHYYDGNMTQTVDHSVHPEDTPNTYRIYTHYDACEQFGGPSDPSLRSNLSDQELVADGLMPRNAFASPADWERSILVAGTRVCDTYALFNNADDSPAMVNGGVVAPRVGPWLPQQPHRSHDGSNGVDCRCVNFYDTWVGQGNTGPLFSGFAGDGNYPSTQYPPGIQHVAQYAYSWVPTVTAGPGPVPDVAAASVWVGSAGLFGDDLQQTGLEVWWNGCSIVCLNFQTKALFWECVLGNRTTPPPCNGAQIWLDDSHTNIGDEVTMYVSGNYHWDEDDSAPGGPVSSGNYGPVTDLKAAEWITEAPSNYHGSANGGNSTVYPLADFGNTGIADMKWMSQQAGVWYDAGFYDNDYINYDGRESSLTNPSIEETSTANPYYINSTWNYGQATWWQRYY